MSMNTKTTNKKESSCTPCEKNFERSVNRTVREGKAPTAKAHSTKSQEVKAAYSSKPTTSKTTVKSTATAKRSTK